MMKNLVLESESLMLHQFIISKRLNGLLKAMVMPFQEVLEHLEMLHHGRYIDDAQGGTLDVIGRIVDFPRHEMSDEGYRVWLKVAILLNNGHGTAIGIFDILHVLFGNSPKIQIDEYEPNIVMFTFFQYPNVPAKILFSIIRRAVPLSTKCQFVDASSSIKTASIKEVTKQDLPTFQLDATSFDESAFAEFFKEDF